MTRLAEALKKKFDRYGLVGHDIARLINVSEFVLDNLAFKDKYHSLTLKDYMEICKWLGVDPKEYLEDYK